MTALSRIAFLAGSAGPGEVILVFLVILVLFGPKRLPEIARALGRVMNELRRAAQDFRNHLDEIGEESPRAAAPKESAPGSAVKPATPSDKGTVSAEEPEGPGAKHDLAG